MSDEPDPFALMDVPTPFEPGFVARIVADPHDDTHRLVYADWLDENGGAPFAAKLRNPADRRASARCAEWLELGADRFGIGVFWRSAGRVPAGTIRLMWRQWLPWSVSRLTHRATSEVQIVTGPPLVIRFPTRGRRNPTGVDPWAAVEFRIGLPHIIECDSEDWSRCGPDMVRLFPWVRWRECRWS